MDLANSDLETKIAMLTCGLPVMNFRQLQNSKFLSLVKGFYH